MRAKSTIVNCIYDTDFCEGQFRLEYLRTVFESSLSVAELPAQLAVINAYNHDGTLCASGENQRRNQAFRHLLQNRAMRHWQVTGCSPDGSHREPGYGIQLRLEAAVELTRQFQQEAIFWIDNDELTLVSCGDVKAVSLGSWTARLRGIAGSRRRPKILKLVFEVDRLRFCTPG